MIMVNWGGAVISGTIRQNPFPVLGFCTPEKGFWLFVPDMYMPKLLKQGSWCITYLDMFSMMQPVILIDTPFPLDYFEPVWPLKTATSVLEASQPWIPWPLVTFLCPASSFFSHLCVKKPKQIRWKVGSKKLEAAPRQSPAGVWRLSSKIVAPQWKQSAKNRVGLKLTHLQGFTLRSKRFQSRHLVLHFYEIIFLANFKPWNNSKE